MKIINIIKSLAKNPDSRNLVSNFGYLSILQIASYAFPLITIPYLARVIGSTGFGKIAFASAVIVWIQTITDWGFGYTATRDVAQNRDNKEVVSEIFSNVLWAKCLLCILSGIILWGLIMVIPLFRDNYLILGITYMLVPGQVLFPDWFFQALEKMKYMTIFNVAVKLFFTISVFVFIKTPDDYWLQPLFTSLGFLLSGLISLYMIVIRWGYKISKPSIVNIVKTIKNGADVFLNQLMPNLYNSFSVIILGFIGGPVANGILDGGAKFVNVVIQFQTMLSRVFFPYLSRRLDKHSIYARINLGTSVLFAAILVSLSPFISHIFFGDGFNNAWLVIDILAVSLVFISMNNVYGVNYLIIIHKEKTLRNITVVASIIGMLMAYPMIKHLSYIGAALVITISRGLLGLSSFFYVRKIGSHEIDI